ncbi:MAG: phytoene/squalene synthase family protein [Bryobacteraceae bacterium]
MSSAIAPVLNPAELEASYRYCRDVARKRAKNFYCSFLLLQRPQRDAMCAIYAFMRYCDDLSDDPANSDRGKLSQSITLWRVELDRALAGHPGENPLWPAFSDSVRRYAIPHRFFHEMIDGIMSDLQPQTIQTWDELYRYCYHVASVVGLTIIHVFGFRSVRALLLAEKCGIAFQLTNILRDVREDAEMGRVYLPSEDLARFGVTMEQLRSGSEDDKFRRLMAFECARARSYYEESAPLEALIDPKSRRSLWALRQIYLTLLGKLERAHYSVLSSRINVPTRSKVALLLRAFLRR